MITGAHVMIFSRDEAADRRFIQDVLGLYGFDAGGGWLIFALPRAELGVHNGANDVHQVYFICEDLDAALEALEGHGVTPSAPVSASWGRSIKVPLPGGGTIGLYEATHARP
jgi:hypothetical protein